MTLFVLTFLIYHLLQLGAGRAAREDADGLAGASADDDVRRLMRRTMDKSWYSAAEGLVPSAVLAHIVRYNLYNPMETVDDVKGSAVLVAAGGGSSSSPTAAAAAAAAAAAGAGTAAAAAGGAKTAASSETPSEEDTSS